jgi:hypothetical protein
VSIGRCATNFNSFNFARFWKPEIWGLSTRLFDHLTDPIIESYFHNPEPVYSEDNSNCPLYSNTAAIGAADREATASGFLLSIPLPQRSRLPSRLP